MPDYNQKQKKPKFYSCDTANKGYACVPCNLIFNSKIEYEAHMAKQVCNGEAPKYKGEHSGEKPGLDPDGLTYKVGKRIFNNKKDYEVFLGEYDPQELKDRRGVSDLYRVGKTLNGTRPKGGRFRLEHKSTEEAAQVPQLPVELYNKIEASEEKVTTEPSIQKGSNPVGFYEMAEDILGKDYSLSWLQVGNKVRFHNQLVPIVEVLPGGVYYIEINGQRIRQQSHYSLYGNLSKEEMDKIIAAYKKKHSVHQYVQKNDTYIRQAGAKANYDNPGTYTFGRTTYTNKIGACPYGKR